MMFIPAPFWSGSSEGGGASYPLIVFNAYTLLPDPEYTVMGNALDERNEWLTYLTPGFDVLTFEGDASGTQYMDVTTTLNGLDMEMPTNGFYSASATGIVRIGTSFNRFNTTSGGSKFLNRLGSVDESSGNPPITFEFPVNISAFGMYLTDCGDFGGTFTLRLTRSDDVEFDYVLWETFADPAPPGMLNFFGFVDGQETYKRIEIFNSASTGDLFGIDDVVWLPASQLTTP